MLKRFFAHPSIGYIQLFICIITLLVGAVSGWRSDKFLRDVHYLPEVICRTNPDQYVVTQVKNTERCVTRVDAETWQREYGCSRTAIAIFLVILFTPAIFSGRFRLDGWRGTRGPSAGD